MNFLIQQRNRLRSDNEQTWFSSCLNMRRRIDAYGNFSAGYSALSNGVELKYFAQNVSWLHSWVCRDSDLTLCWDFRWRKEVRMWANATQRNRATTMAARPSGPMWFMLDQSFLDMFVSFQLQWGTEDAFVRCRVFETFSPSLADVFLFPNIFVCLKNWLPLHISHQGQHCLIG